MHATNLKNEKSITARFEFYYVVRTNAALSKCFGRWGRHKSTYHYVCQGTNEHVYMGKPLQRIIHHPNWIYNTYAYIRVHVCLSSIDVVSIIAYSTLAIRRWLAHKRPEPHSIVMVYNLNSRLWMFRFILTQPSVTSINGNISLHNIHGWMIVNWCTIIIDENMRDKTTQAQPHQMHWSHLSRNVQPITECNQYGLKIVSTPTQLNID